MKRTTLCTTLVIVIASCFCAHADVTDSPAAMPKAKVKPTELVFGNPDPVVKISRGFGRLVICGAGIHEMASAS